MPKFKPTFLFILDGYGLAPKSNANAVTLANTPTLNKIFNKENPLYSELLCSGRNVGLPSGFMGNSEVGHLNIGAGRIVNQEMTRIDIVIENNELEQNFEFLELLKKTKAKGANLHLLGLLSDAGVHSHIDHLLALLALAKKQGVQTYVHAFTDGRDTSPTSGLNYVKKLLDKFPEALASVCGRYYAMDRDKRWDRVKLAWDALVHGQAKVTSDPLKYIEEAYASSETDEFMKPFLIKKAAGLKNIKDDDSILFFNFRADRIRQLAHAFSDSTFTDFERGKVPKLSGITCIVEYDSSLKLPVMFKGLKLTQVLGEVVANLNLKQLRIAETEKYAHVTYFFNGGEEEPFKGEDRVLIPSPKDVATYDLKPEMSAVEVKDKLIAKWKENKYSLVVCNFANADMVGHTANIEASIKACETLDACLQELLDFAAKNNCRVIVTADHGNAEVLRDEHGKPFTSHTLNNVPLAIIDESLQLSLKKEGRLADIAPTILALWSVDIPKEMTGNVLIVK